MLTDTQNFFVIIALIAGALGFLWLVQRFWPTATRREHNDIIGWHVSVLGTTYAVIIGFMLYAVWTTFQSADINADTEANCVINLYRLADGLPATQRVQIHQLLREYDDRVINIEWPSMTAGNIVPAGHAVIQRLWSVVMQTKPATFAEQTSMNLALTELSSLTEHRRVRELESQSSLPGILWAVLIVGGALTTLSSCLFGTQNFKLHCIQVFSLTLLIALSLVAIADIDRPFQGAVHVSTRAFERARATIAETPAESPDAH
jgi:hypothetical protein